MVETIAAWADDGWQGVVQDSGVRSDDGQMDGGMSTVPLPASQGELLAALHAEAAARRDALATVAAELRHDRGTETADDEHDPEGVTLSMEWGRVQGLLAAADAELAEVDDAWKRWRSNAYGRCEACGRAIPTERLRVRPTARRCVSCAERPG
jgi:DnaK suppressor protein